MQIDALEQQYVFRPYHPGVDIPRLSRMLSDIEAVDHDGEETSEEALCARLTWPNHHPEQDCRVVEAPGDSHTLIGYSSVFAQTAERSTLYVAVHPDWRRRGLRSTLLAPAGITLEEPRWPAGYTVRSYAGLQHLPALVEVHNRSFADQWGHAENYQATTGEMIVNSLSSTDPAGIFLAFAPDGSVAGFCHAIPTVENDNPDGDPKDLLDAPGVVPEHRHRGL